MECNETTNKEIAKLQSLSETNYEENQHQNLPPDQIVKNFGCQINETFAAWEYMLRESKDKEEETQNQLDNMVRQFYLLEASVLERRLEAVNKIIKQR